MSIPDVLLASVQRGYIEDVRVMFKDQYMLVQDEMGNTLLHIAAGSGHAEVVQFLLAQKGSNKALQMKNHIGDTPLHRAAFRGHVAVCKMLLAAGADPAAKNSKGRTPATIAREDSLRSLLDNQGGEGISFEDDED